MIHKIEIIGEDVFKIKAKIDGKLYEKSKWIQYETDKFFLILEKENADNSPHIICSCGNDNFTLSYGDYSLKAICTNCGSEQTVYDG